jgi:sugar (pentulose or hexulose) kinase
VEAAFGAVVPPFDETLSPQLPAGINYGKQLFWIEAALPRVFMAAQAIVPYPQYWGCKLGAPPVSEITSIGCHTHLWSPRRNDFSSLVDARGWRAKFPALVRAGEVIGSYCVGGTRLRVHNGVHDSNAALYLHRRVAGHADATLVSTGTWVVALNPSCPIDALEAERDMLVNVSVDGEVIPTARFMGGREFDLVSDAARLPVTPQDLERAIRLEQFALPSFAAGGPFPGASGRLIGPSPQSQRERAAIATLYVACMTSIVLDLLRSQGTIILDGGLAYNEAYTGVLAALRPGQRVLTSPLSEGTAAGAAAIAYAALGRRPDIGPYAEAEPLQAIGLARYFEQWRRLSEAA